MNNLLNKEIFVVEDDPFTCLLYKKHLKNLGFGKINHFFSGIDCLNNLHISPEIVLLDHDMDEITGFEILLKLKRHNPDIAVIMVSGQEKILTAVDALKYGAFDYIIKGDKETDRISATLERYSRLLSIKASQSKSLLNKLFFKA